MIKVGVAQKDVRTDYRDVAVLLPAYNEEAAVGDTVQAFLQALPGCTVIVCNNCSTDQTVSVARAAGAQVINENMSGKGNAVRRLFATVDANLYVMADADTTYDANAAREMIEKMQAEHLDMVTGVRVHSDKTAYRRGHVWGNLLFNKLFSRLFKSVTHDVFSGYRVLSGRFARSLPVQSTGFEIETEMTAVATILKLSVGEVPVNYYPRPAGSFSKLNTYKDGFKILLTYVRLIRHFYPKRFYGLISVVLAMLSVVLGLPVVFEYLETGLVPRFPTAILASSIGMLSVFTLMSGLLLESIAKSRIEQRQLALLIKEK